MTPADKLRAQIKASATTATTATTAKPKRVRRVIRAGDPTAWRRDPEARAEAKHFRCD